jgi:hypothetical protein
MNLISMRSGLMVLPLFGAGSLLLAHLLTAAAFGRRTDTIIARLEQVSVAEPSTPPVPAIIQSFAQRAVCENPVPNAVWLSQSGKMRANLRNRWRTFTAEQVISIYQPGFAWLARMQSSGSAPFWFVAPPGACGGSASGQARIDALPRRTRTGAAHHSAQPAAVLVRNRCNCGRSQL